jgi:hypothetical protein
VIFPFLLAAMTGLGWAINGASGAAQIFLGLVGASITAATFVLAGNVHDVRLASRAATVRMACQAGVTLIIAVINWKVINASAPALAITHPGIATAHYPFGLRWPTISGIAAWLLTLADFFVAITLSARPNPARNGLDPHDIQGNPDPDDDSHPTGS